MARGAVWTVGARLVMRGAGLINIVILARLAEPDAFGIIFYAAAFIAAFEAMTDMSLTAALVRSKDRDPRAYDTVFTLNLLRGTALAAICLAAAGPLAESYGDDRLRDAAYVFALNVFLLGLINPGSADFQRDMAWGKDFIFMAGRKLTGVPVSIACALTIWPDHRALLASLITGTVCAVVLSYVLSAHRPRLTLAKWRDLVGFSGWMTLSNALSFLRARLDALILPSVAGFGALGVYGPARELAGLVSSELAMPIRRALLPGFSRLAQDRAALGDAMAGALSAMLIVAAPISVGLALTADAILRLAYGPAWVSGADAMRVLALHGFLTVGTVFCWPALVAMNKPGRLALGQLAAVVIGGPAIWFGAARWGLTGAAVGACIVQGIYLLLALAAALRLSGLTPARAFAAAPRVAGACAFLAAGVLILRAKLPPMEGVWGGALHVFASAGAGVVLYVSTLFALWRLSGSPPGLEVAATVFIKQRLSRSRPRPERTRRPETSVQTPSDSGVSAP